jgi:serine/threonine protein kinase
MSSSDAALPSAGHPPQCRSSSTARSPTRDLLPPSSSFDPAHLADFSEWREVSDGGYSEVYKARMLGTVVAVKKATSRKKTSGDALLREIRYLELAGPHPNIVIAYGAFRERSRLHLVLEFAPCLRNDRVARACDPVLVVSGVARALIRLHGLGILHRDLKARNVLVANGNRPLLIDFGLACHTGLDPPDWLCRTVGTKKYRPPEMRDGRPSHPSMDMYCLGLLIEKLLRQRRECDSDEPGGEKQQEADGAREGPREGARDAGREAAARGDAAARGVLNELATLCTSREPQERPSAWQVLMRLQRVAYGEATEPCDALRQVIPMSAEGAARMLQERAREAEAEAEEESRSRKRRRDSVFRRASVE